MSYTYAYVPWAEVPQRITSSESWYRPTGGRKKNTAIKEFTVIDTTSGELFESLNHVATELQWSQTYVSRNYGTGKRFQRYVPENKQS